MPARPSGGSIALARRIAQLCNEVWDGNQTQMARDLGLSQPLMHRVVTSHQPPPATLIESLAKRYDVDLNWLLRGEGTVRGPAVPVVTSPVAELPTGREPGDGEPTFSLATIPSRRSQVWLRMTSEEPVVHEPEHGVRVGDMLLIETDPKHFPAAEKLWETYCLLRTGQKKNERLILAEVSYTGGDDPEGGPAHLKADTFDLGIRARDIVEEIGVRKHRGELMPFRRKFKVVGEGTRRKKASLTDRDVDPILRRIKYDEIAGVCLILVRKKMMA